MHEGPAEQNRGDVAALPQKLMTGSLLNVDRVSKSFGDFVAVDDVSLELSQGEALAIVGESGSGKTTLARMIVGLERPSAGTITCLGNDRSKPARTSKERRRRGREIQIVFQDPTSSLDRRQTVRSALDEVLRLHYQGSAEQRAARILELAAMVGLNDRQLRALPRSLSGGQCQRVAIARALAAEPKILILDESVSALDVSIQAQVLNLIADIREQTGLPYLFISHDLAVVRQVTDYAIVMRHGRVVERGPTAMILDDPQSDYTKLLRESVPEPGWKPKRQVTSA